MSGDTNGNDELDLTETWLYEATGEAIAGQYNNLGTAVGTPPVGDDVDATDDDCYFGESPDICITRYTNGANAVDCPTDALLITWALMNTSSDLDL